VKIMQYIHSCNSCVHLFTVGTEVIKSFRLTYYHEKLITSDELPLLPFTVRSLCSTHMCKYFLCMVCDLLSAGTEP